MGLLGFGGLRLIARNIEDRAQHNLVIRMQAKAHQTQATLFNHTRQVSEWHNWTETYAFVLFSFGERHQQVYAFELVRRLIQDPDIGNTIWKAETAMEWNEREGEWEKD